MHSKILPIFDFTSLPSLHAHEFQPPNPRSLCTRLHDLFTFIWARDTHEFDHPRYRIQVAFAILLLFHLGLHPKDALVEGFSYADTQVLVQWHNDSLRVLLLIRLRAPKRPLAERWCGTMILADDPARRHMCPVTMFLSMAIADGVLDNIRTPHDVASLTTHRPPHWTLLPYRDDRAKSPVLRRKVHTKSISASALKPTMLYAMMLAQINRAGHNDTLAAILEDRDKAVTSQRLRKNSALLIGRGQGELMETLLAATNVIQHKNPNKNAIARPDLKYTLAIPEALEIQLRYDYPRSLIISHLFGVYSSLNGIPGILWPFIEIASPTPHEPFYSETAPNKFGGCTVCGRPAARSLARMKTHLLKCCQRKKNFEAEKLLTPQISDRRWRCSWACCSYNCFSDKILVAYHMREHIDRARLKCEWDSCETLAEDTTALHAHLSIDHAVPTEMTLPTQAQFCIECNLWTSTGVSWQRHKEFHTKYPSIIYGPVMVGGLLAAPRKCPYCISKGYYVTYEQHDLYIKHIEAHMDEHEDCYGESQLLCPHFSCGRETYAKRELKAHFEKTHGISFC